MKKTIASAIGSIVILVVVLLAAYAYITRPTKAPSESSEQAQATLTLVENVNASETPLQESERRFRIVQEETTATFTLNEVLNGQPKTVIGTNGSVSGELIIDRKNLEASNLGTIRINGRAFVTDNDRRNNAIRRYILKTESDEHEFLLFRPTEISVEPNTADTNETFAFEITGELTIAGRTKPVTFAGSGVFASDNRFTGHAETMFRYADIGIAIPNIPFVANVDKDVLLSIDFAAEAN